MKQYEMNGDGSLTAFTLATGMITLYDGGNTSASVTKVKSDLWRIYKGNLPAPAYNAPESYPYPRTVYVFPMPAQYTSDPSKVAVVNIGSYSGTENAVTVNFDIQHSIRYYDGSIMNPVMVPNFGGMVQDMTGLAAPYDISIKFADSVLVQ